MFFSFLLLRIPIPRKIGFISNRYKEKQKISKNENAFYYVQSLNPKFDFDDFTKKYNISQNLFLPISKNTYSCLLSHKSAEALSKDENFWVRKIPSKDKIPKSETGYYSTLCPRSCKLPGEVITRTDYYAIIRYTGPIEKLAKTTCARLFSPYLNNIELHARYHRGLTHNFPYSSQYDPKKGFISRSRLNESGYTGFGQCISVIDTGLDNNSMWFQRESELTDPKILSVYPLADEVDEYSGHGTFVAGIAAGKATCSDYARTFNGVAEDAKILVVDIKNQKTGNLAFPENLLDLYEPCVQLKCPITLNAWTSDDILLKTAIDIIAFDHPSLLMIFPTTPDENGYIKTPGNAKNILSVGSTYGHLSSRAVFSTNTPVTVYNSRTQDYSFGYTDPSGTPLLNSTFTREKEEITFEIGNKEGQIAIIHNSTQQLTDFKNIAAAFLFHQEKINDAVGFPVIRLPYFKQNKFDEGDLIQIFSPPITDEGPSAFNKIDKNNGFYIKNNPFYAKPELVAPGGPMIGPLAGSNKCGLEGLTVKEGPSVSAAIIAGDCAIIRQYLQNTALKGTKNISASAIRGTLAIISHDLYANQKKGPFAGIGFGTPQIEDLFSKQNKFIVFQDHLINSGTRDDYCFDIEENGILKVALVWNDYPRDPLSHDYLTQPLHLTVASNENPYNHYLSNNDDNDTPTLDMFNTVKLVTMDVKQGTRIRISVTAGDFEIPKPANYALTILGPIQKTENQTCTGYFTSGNCPRGCEGRGSSCNQNKLCTCGYDRGGDFCSFKTEKIHSESKHKISFTKRFEWKFFKLLPDNWQEGTSLVVTFDEIDFSKVGLFVHVGTMPKWDDYLCSENYCPWAQFDEEQLSYTFKYEDWNFLSKQHMISFGFYSKTKFPYSFKVRFETQS